MGDVTPYVPIDMTKEELKALQEYRDNGHPGLIKLQEVDQFKWFNLYMAGKTYSEIAEITNSKRDLILFVSFDQKWAVLRLNHYEEMIHNIMTKTTHAKLEGANTISNIITALNRYYTKKFNKYLSTNDDSIIENLDSKTLTQYYKSIETLDKLMASAKPLDLPESGTANPNTSNISVNLGTSAEIKRNEDGSVEITDNTVRDLLMGLSQIKKDSKKQ